MNDNPPAESTRPKQGKRLPPLVIAGLLFAGAIYPVILKHQREIDDFTTAVSEGSSTADGFLNALDARRYTYAFMMLTPAAQSSLSPTALKQMALPMRNSAGKIMYRRLQPSKVEAFDGTTIVTLHYNVQSASGEKQVDFVITQTPEGTRIENFKAAN